MPYLRGAVGEKPGNAEAETNLGLALALGRQFDEAISHLQTAVAAAPDSFEYRFNLGRILAAGGRFAEAVPEFEQAVRLSDGRESLILDMLGGAYAETGRFRDAAQAARQALELANQQGDPQFVDALKSRLSFYVSRIPQPR